MSDLHRAVQDELDAHRPDRVPPFAAVRGRKQAHRRRLAAGGAALSAVAIAAAAVLAPSPAGGPDRLPTTPAAPATTAPTAAGDDEAASFTVRYSVPSPVARATVERVDACLALPGVRHGDKLSSPPVHGVTVTGSSEAEAFAACVRALADAGVTLTEHRPPALDTDADIAAFVESCAWGRKATPVPGYVGMTQQQVLAPDVPSRILGRDGACNPGSPVPDPTIVDVVIADGVVVWAGHLEVAGQSVPRTAAPVLPQDPAGAEICKGDDGSQECYDIGRDQAAQLAAALATGTPRQPTDPQCTSTPGDLYRITWLPASRTAHPAVWTVPTVDCVPVEAAGTTYDLDQEARRLVARTWDGAGLFALDATTTGKRPPSLPRG